MKNDQFYIGKVIEDSNDKLFGVIRYGNNEIYASSTPDKSSKVIFIIKNIGPRKKTKRAVNVFSYNELLDSLKWNHKYEDKKEEVLNMIFELGYSGEKVSSGNKNIHIEVVAKIKENQKTKFLNSIRG